MMLPLAARRAIALAIVLGATLVHVQVASAAGVQVFTASLTGAQQVPSVTTPATGTGTVVLNAAETHITVNLTFSGLTSAANAAHIHGTAPAGSNAGVLFDFTGVTPGATSGTIPEQTFAITPAQIADLRAGLFYFNVHTATNGGGEIRGQIGFAAVQFNTTLSGAQQVPAVSSSGSGTGTVALNATEDKLFVNLSFAGLTSNAIMAHIHGSAGRTANAGILFDFTGVTPNATSGSIPQQTYSITSAQVADLKAGLFYFNVHTTNNSGGEIRGQIEAAGPTVTLDRAALIFGAASSGTALTSQTPSQTVRVIQTAGPQITWTASSNRPWLTVTPTFGYGSSALAIGVKFDSTLPASGSATGAITIGLSGAGNTVAPINVTLNVVPSTAAASPPFGSFDTPVGDASVLAGSVAVTGWSLDNIGVKQVEIWRDLQPGETTPPFSGGASDPRTGKVFIANATFVEGARPDVQGLYPTTPANYKAGWGYLMLTWGLFGQGNGTYKLYAFGVDQESNTATLGSKTIVVSNNTATKPFGSIDTPAIGGDPGTQPNFGWGLTPKVNGAATCRIPSNGVQVSIDSGPLQPVVYGDARADIAGAFPGFSNSAGAGGHFIFDWSTLPNGAHTIGWLITDDCNRADGVGSRFFTVTTGGSAPTGTPPYYALPGLSAALREGESDAAITVARGYGELPAIVAPGEAGSRTIDVKQGERIEIRVPRGFESAYQLESGGQRRVLPAGSTWDAASGTFYWEPAAAFLGRFRLVFSNGAERISVRVVVTP
jgi:hypothetical protein